MIGVGYISLVICNIIYMNGCGTDKSAKISKNCYHGCDGIDNDGDGKIDEDGPDGIDNDGDGKIDEDWDAAYTQDGIDNDGDGEVDEDIPDGIDNDWDGLVDED